MAGLEWGQRLSLISPRKGQIPPVAEWLSGRKEQKTTYFSTGQALRARLAKITPNLSGIHRLSAVAADKVWILFSILHDYKWSMSMGQQFMYLCT